MVQNGYVTQVTSKHDRRSYTIRLSDKGMDLCRKLDKALDRHVENLKNLAGISSLDDLVEALKSLESFWRSASVQKLRTFSAKKR